MGYSPPLGRWSHTWRAAVCLLISLSTWGLTWRAQWDDHRVLFWVDLVVGLLAYGLCFFRRRWPLTIALLLAAMLAVSGVAAGPAVLAATSYATRRRLGRIVVVGALMVLAGQVYAHSQPGDRQGGFFITTGDSTTRSEPGRGPTLLDALTSTLFTAGVLGWGMYIGSRRELLWTLRERAESAEAEQELRVGNARTAERTQIAREMHDVLAHRISRVSMHAGAIAFREDLTVEELRQEARVIQEQANAALTELRGVLGVLRSPETGELASRPQPTYADLGDLLGEARESGMHVEVTDDLGAGAALPDAVGRTVYRILQEGLTNARKHAPGALVRVQLSGSPDTGVDVRMRNPLGFGATAAAPGAGLGLVGLAERAALRGGRLEHRNDGTTFELHVWIPWAA